MSSRPIRTTVFEVVVGDRAVEVRLEPNGTVRSGGDVLGRVLSRGRGRGVPYNARWAAFDPADEPAGGGPSAVDAATALAYRVLRG